MRQTDIICLLAALVILSLGVFKYFTSAPVSASDALGAPVISLVLGLLLLGSYRDEISGLINRVTSISNKGIDFGTPTAAGKVQQQPDQGAALESEPVKLLTAPETLMPNNKNVPSILTEQGWNDLYDESRSLFLTHQIRPSQKPGMKFDVYIYLDSEPTEPSQLNTVKRALFYLGPDWGTQPFISYPQTGKRIGLETSAYGPVLCACVIEFEDDSRAELHRWIDFEMAWVFSRNS